MRVVYVSYDGAGEPLGQSQIVAYLERLARKQISVHLLSFEKPDCDRDRLNARLTAAGIRWTPLRYHRHPPVVSTLTDVVRGARAVEQICRRAGPVDVVHVRSDVAGLMARLSPTARRSRLLFDIRGFWADERVEAGIWRRGLLYRLAKREELRLFLAADAVVTLTEASVPQIEPWLASEKVPVRVIPTCTDVARYAGTVPRTDGPHAVWTGSITTWYRFDLAVRLARALGRPLTVLTRERAAAERVIRNFADNASPPSTVQTVSPSEMPLQLHRQDIGLCLVRPSYAKLASAPTRFAEFLAAGMPVVVVAGVGDLESIIERHGVGHVLRGDEDRDLADAAQSLLSLAENAAVAERCRQVARDLFDLDVGVSRYAELYETLRRPTPAGQ